ncbi:hypothetical protein M918_19000 [Clostridium sp. BL8]|uniref:hypothetical protein n=1 Tax=Clostridium sp. BL8 TaxID=1354301 RepID=UPI00038A4AFF|nr:hypothetical protein [Clostridium sp. BL8]EQB89767.1 hypothetical protein M918_19000 [Clostridium sp. BL8]
MRKIQVNEINKIILEAKQNCEEISNVISNRANLKYIDFFGTLKNQFSLKRKSLLQMNVVLNSVDFIELKNRLKNFINKHELLRTHITCEDEKYFFLTCDKVEDIPIYVVELLNCTHEDALESKLKILNELRVDFVKKSFLNEILWNWVIFKEDDNFEVFIIIDHKISDGFAEGIIKRDLLKESKKLINSEIDSYFEYVDVTRKSMTQEKIDLYYNSEDYNKLKNSVNNFLNNSDKENHNNESAYRRAFKYKILEDISYNNEEKERIAFNLIVNMCGVLFNTNEIPIRVTRHGRHFDNKNYIGATRCNMKRIA